MITEQIRVGVRVYFWPWSRHQDWGTPPHSGYQGERCPSPFSLGGSTPRLRHHGRALQGIDCLHLGGDFLDLVGRMLLASSQLLQQGEGGKACRVSPPLEKQGQSSQINSNSFYALTSAHFIRSN